MIQYTPKTSLLPKSQPKKNKTRKDFVEKKYLTLTADSTRLAKPRGSFIQIPLFPCQNFNQQKKKN